ncbi:hypothetical protein GRF29_8g3430659 [Pseudopithomyces chartarum]|uniref:Uncharacterized protein n=1 Tax=Pseudopithomyces chartarum TaxID=1892770 RepID=A0AAN6RMU7_9PLEO|nr:hypothetical protein GRF29_8g3430659 [Pseudopithomyces chartarum]
MTEPRMRQRGKGPQWEQRDYVPRGRARRLARAPPEDQTGRFQVHAQTGYGEVGARERAAGDG